MIALNRIRTTSAIKAKYRGADKRDKDITLMKAQKDKLNGLINKVEFDSTFWKLSKTQLKKESFGKCAYCEAITEVVAHGDVEHYRPKSVYWWLAYTYDNYLYACQICNQIYKSDNFPVGGTLLLSPPVEINSTDNDLIQLAGNISPDPIDISLGFTLQTFLQHHTQESAFLLNPYFDNPAKYIAYEADDLLEEIKIIPANPQFQHHINAMEDFYGINRIELANFRYFTFRNFRTYKKMLNENISSGLRKDLIKEINFMKSDKSLFAGMVRFFDNIL
jgi:hypothetical protein